MSILKRTGLLFGFIFLAGTIFNALQFVFQYSNNPVSLLTDWQFWFLTSLTGLLFASAYIGKIAFIQPMLFIATAPIAIMQSYEGFYGLGFFVIGVLLLFRLGFFIRHSAVKIFLLLAYLFAWELLSATRNNQPIAYAISPLFFISSFIVFLYLAYKEKLMVYLKEPKPRLSLDEKGLSPAEKTYVLAVLAGRNHKEIAVDYEVSDSTVRNTISRAYQKLEVSDKAGLAVLAERFEIVV